MIVELEDEGIECATERVVEVSRQLALRFAMWRLIPSLRLMGCRIVHRFSPSSLPGACVTGRETVDYSLALIIYSFLSTATPCRAAAFMYAKTQRLGRPLGLYVALSGDSRQVEFSIRLDKPGTLLIT